ncbi:MAG: NAD-dependent epimerase/dehydratase family protein [Candidatus Altiarchaeota archaeon]|nr:NAD-dependent epimerase/dehydratase family protein [Candidatus Altiarchaeota archaeon]
MTGEIVITGAKGFIGRHLVEQLEKRGYKVFGCDIEKKQSRESGYARVDIRRCEEYEKLPKNPEAVIHLAAISYLPQAQKNIQKAYDINVFGTYNMLKYFQVTGAEKFIYASSSKVYGKPQKLPIDENHPIRPDTTYGRTKALSEELILKFSKEHSGAYTVLRQFNIFGPGQADTFFIPTLLSQLSEKDRIVLGNINVSRDFLYIDDLVNAYMRILKSKDNGVGIYNVGSGKPTKLEKIIELCIELSGKNPEISFDKKRIRADERVNYCSNKRIKKTGWKPKKTIAEGLKKTMVGYGF